MDGGGDALLEFGLVPDIIIGDMDSVSDRALRKCKEIVVHAYMDGRAPGMERINRLGLKAEVLCCPGTSEDIAMLAAYENGAELIVAVGAHSSIIDFLEKGRRGMGSTFLTRLKVGDRLVDAKGKQALQGKGKAETHSRVGFGCHDTCCYRRGNVSAPSAAMQAFVHPSEAGTGLLRGVEKW